MQVDEPHEDRDGIMSRVQW